MLASDSQRTCAPVLPSLNPSSLPKAGAKVLPFPRSAMDFFKKYFFKPHMLLIVKKKKNSNKAKKKESAHRILYYTAHFFRKNKAFVPIKTLFLPQIMQR